MAVIENLIEDLCKQYDNGFSMEYIAHGLGLEINQVVSLFKSIWYMQTMVKPNGENLK